MTSRSIAFVITRADELGGAQVHLRELASAVHAHGFQAAVFGGSPGLLSEQLAAQGIPFIEVKSLARQISIFRDVRAIFELRSLLKSARPTLVSAHSSKAGWISRIAAKSLGIPAVFTAHGWAFTEGVAPLKRWLYRMAERLAAFITERIITVSNYDRSLAIRYNVGTPSKIVTVHNGVPEIRSDLHARPEVEPPTIVMVARFAEPKNHSILLHALAQLTRHSWRLIFVGAGPTLEFTKALSTQLSLQDRVNFLGERVDVAELLSHSQLFVLTSNWEGLPLTILEAMRAGLPVIASRVGGIPEAVEDEVTGYLCTPDSVVDLAQKLRTLIENPALRARMGTEGRARYQTLFRLDKMVAGAITVYSAALAASS